MAYSIANNQLLRKHFAEIQKIIDIPNLIDIQKNSYKRFLQAELPPSARQNIGLEAVFRADRTREGRVSHVDLLSWLVSAVVAVRDEGMVHYSWTGVHTHLFLPQSYIRPAPIR